ncbi:MAG: glycosyltransferase [Thermoleophilaceae bacterium]
MRVVLISREHPTRTSGGGIGTYTMTMAPALAERGHEVEVVTEGTGGAHLERGVHVVPLEHRSLPAPTASRLLTARRVARAARRDGAEIVQAAEWEAEAWWLARTGGAPLVTRLATPTYLVDRLNLGRQRDSTHVVRRMERDQALRSQAIVAPSESIADRVAADWRLDRARIEVIPNPVDGEAIRTAGAAEPVVPLPARFVLFIGRIERRKGVETLAAALPEALSAHPDLHAVFLGRDAGAAGGDAGCRLDELSELFPRRVHRLGALPREQALPIVARATLVVLPSLWEAFGFVAVEAMALGRPVVASSGSGFAEIISHGRSGWLVPPGDATALADALVERINDAVELERISRGARLRADDFEASRIAPMLERVYERAIEGAGNAGHFTQAIYTGGYRRFFRPEDSANPFRRIYEAKLEAVLTRLRARPPMRVLDVGCGPGRALVPLAAHHEMTGCDVSAEMLEEARRRSPSDVRLVRADARELPFGDDSFDAVIALDLLAHLPDLRAGVSELARVVRSGGPVIFDTSNAEPWWVLAYPSYVNWRPRRLIATMRRGGVLPEWSDIVRHHRADEVRVAITEAGLWIDDLDTFGPPWTPKWHLWHTRKGTR